MPVLLFNSSGKKKHEKIYLNLVYWLLVLKLGRGLFKHYQEEGQIRLPSRCDPSLYWGGSKRIGCGAKASNGGPQGSSYIKARSVEGSTCLQDYGSKGFGSTKERESCGATKEKIKHLKFNILVNLLFDKIATWYKCWALLASIYSSLLEIFCWFMKVRTQDYGMIIV